MYPHRIFGAFESPIIMTKSRENAAAFAGRGFRLVSGMR